MILCRSRAGRRATQRPCVRPGDLSVLLVICAALLCAALIGCSDSPPARDERPDLQLTAPDTETPDTSPPEDTAEDAPPDVVEVDLPDADPDATDPPLPPGLWIATFNVERFFDTVCDSGSCSFSDFEPPVDDAAFTYNADRVAAGIRGLSADIVLLQEIESEACVEALRQRLEGEYTVITLGETNLPASLDVAVALRGELVKVVPHRYQILPRPDGGTTRFAREFYEVHIQVLGQPVIVFAAHFISKVGGDDSRRQAEATAARAIVLKVAQDNPQALVVMGGDLNDTPDSPPLMTLTDGGALLRVAAELGEAGGTYTFDGALQAIDHLLLAVDAHGGAYVPGTAQVMRAASGRGWANSDHAALRAYFSLTALAP